jgi:hypothetical protein
MFKNMLKVLTDKAKEQQNANKHKRGR